MPKSKHKRKTPLSSPAPQDASASHLPPPSAPSSTGASPALAVAPVAKPSASPSSTDKESLKETKERREKKLPKHLKDFSLGGAESPLPKSRVDSKGKSDQDSSSDESDASAEDVHDSEDGSDAEAYDEKLRFRAGEDLDDEELDSEALAKAFQHVFVQARNRSGTRSMEEKVFKTLYSTLVTILLWARSGKLGPEASTPTAMLKLVSLVLDMVPEDGVWSAKHSKVLWRHFNRHLQLMAQGKSTAKSLFEIDTTIWMKSLFDSATMMSCSYCKKRGAKHTGHTVSYCRAKKEAEKKEAAEGATESLSKQSARSKRADKP